MTPQQQLVHLVTAIGVLLATICMAGCLRQILDVFVRCINRPWWWRVGVGLIAAALLCWTLFIVTVLFAYERA